MVQLLLSKRADINVCNKDGASPIYIASQCGHFEIVRILLRDRAKLIYATKMETVLFMERVMMNIQALWNF